MTTEEMIRELEYIQEKTKNDTYYTFDIRWHDVVTDVIKELQRLLDENARLKQSVSEPLDISNDRIIYEPCRGKTVTCEVKYNDSAKIAVANDEFSNAYNKW